MANKHILTREQGTLFNVARERKDGLLGDIVTDQQPLLDQGVPVMPTETRLAGWLGLAQPWDGRDPQRTKAGR